MPLINRTIVYESSTGSFVDGRYTAGSPTKGTFRGSVQPMPARENRGFKDMPEGRVDIGRVRIYSSVPLKSGGEGGPRGDVVVFEGFRYEIVKAIPNRMGLINHYKYIGEYCGEVTP